MNVLRLLCRLVTIFAPLLLLHVYSCRLCHRLISSSFSEETNMLSIFGAARSVCDGIRRRQILQAGGAGLFGLSVPQLLAAESLFGNAAPKAKSVIFLLLFGGPSQLETFDMKPEAPELIREPFKPIASKTPELRISEHLPRMAAVSEKYRVIRTMSHSFNDHSGGGHYLQTGKRWHVPIGGGFAPTPKDWPSVGSIVEYADQQRFGLTNPIMGRTPKANAQWGRDHWSTLFSTVIAGGGIPGGRVYGRSDKDAAYPVDAAVSPEDLAATIYHALGIDYELRVPNAENRPMPIVDGGHPLTGLWS